jgi:hypothetical protein
MADSASWTAHVDDQEKALRIYTDVNGVREKDGRQPGVVPVADSGLT